LQRGVTTLFAIFLPRCDSIFRHFCTAV
jgi:hypothetical protein